MCVHGHKRGAKISYLTCFQVGQMFSDLWRLLRVTRDKERVRIKMRSSACACRAIFVLVVLIGCCEQVLSFVTTEVKLAPGTSIVGVKKSNYDAFLGIAFARPPLGSLRFRVINGERGIACYTYAKEIFSHNAGSSSCPLVDRHVQGTRSQALLLAIRSADRAIACKWHRRLPIPKYLPA